jgi:hypothetical protein
MAVAIMEVTWCPAGCFWFGRSLPAESALNCTSDEAKGVEALARLRVISQPRTLLKLNRVFDHFMGN